ncbi:MAG TPA: LamG domain-containing protein [Lacipirellulaceae bacterium]
MKRILHCMLSAMCLAGLCAAAQAATVAHWRFEDKNGSPAVAGDFLRSTPAPGGTASGGNTVDVTSDSSGNGNVLRTFHSPNDPNSTDGAQRLETSPTYTLSTPAPVVLQTLQPNLLAFDYDAAPGSDPPAPPDAGGDDIYSRDQENADQPANSHVLNAFTIEASFKIDTLGRFQTIVNKDDDPDAAPGALSPFSLKVLNDNRLEAYAFDGTNDASPADFRGVVSDAPLVANVWYNAAVTNDGSTMRLYIDDTSNGVGDYVLQSATNSGIAGGALVQSNAPWSIGRGWFNGPADFFDGQIDEVRISDVVLAPSQFLFSPIPEPHSVVLLLIAVGGLASRRVKRSD